MLVVNVNTKKLNAILNQESFETLIMDENDNIVASNRVDTQDKSLSNIDLATLSATGQGPHDVTIDGKPFKMVIDHWQPGGSLNSLRIISIFL